MVEMIGSAARQANGPREPSYPSFLTRETDLLVGRFPLVNVVV